MPVPSLPLELIDPILTELRLSCGDDDAARRSNGLATALVCKAWQPLGVEVIWHTVKLDSLDSTRRLLGQAQRFPHFPPLIRAVHLLRTPEPEEDDLSDFSAAADYDDDFAGLSSLWPLCPYLEHLSVATAPWIDYDALCYQLPHHIELKHIKLALNEFGCPYSLRVLPQLARLPRLARLSLTLLIKLDDTDWTLPARTSAPLGLERIEAVVIVSPAAEHASAAPFHLALLNHVDASTLRELTITLAPTDIALVDRIFRFSALRSLAVWLPAAPASLPLLDHLLHTATTHKIPLQLGIVGEMDAPYGDGHATELVLPTAGSSSLSAFLGAVPASVVDFHIRGFHLTLAGPVDRAAPSAVAVDNLFSATEGSTRCSIPLRREGSDALWDCMCVRSARPDGRTVWMAVIEGEQEA
ncbi:hypothetical protein JCM10207_006359 [Rhodosporidiobolus poonsookiae]